MRKLFKILLVIFWMGLIFSFSMDNGDISTGKSNIVIDKIIELFRGEIDTEEKEVVRERYVPVVRKSAHLTLYFFLGLSSFLLISEYNLINKKGLIICISFIFLYACSDEIHQLFVPNRSGEALDVMIDTIGGSLGVFCLYFYYCWREKYEQEETTS